MNEPQGITFVALFGKATTTIDGGWNVTFQVGQEHAKELMQLATLRDTLLQIAVVPVQHGDL